MTHRMRMTGETDYVGNGKPLAELFTSDTKEEKKKKKKVLTHIRIK